jgi:2-polyprenyl-6-methoxyphenol hydroxylase-like FAD-dependent oxidoreductase
VDVLIIGAGASGAAVAWSLADTKMRIVCLEQRLDEPRDVPQHRHREYTARFSLLHPSDFRVKPRRCGRELADRLRHLGRSSRRTTG